MSESSDKAKSAGKVFDVAHPGKSAPSSSAKPIIVTNRPVLKDPMVVETDTAETSESAKPLAPPSRIKITPLSDTEGKTIAEIAESAKSTKAKAKEKDDKNAKDKAEKPIEVPTLASKLTPTDDSSTDTKPEEPIASDPIEKIDTSVESSVATTTGETAETTESDAATDDTADDTEKTDDAPAEGETADPTDDKPAESEAVIDQRALELQQLADSHKYYLPINQVEKQKAKRYAWAGALLIVILAVAWADVAADAGIIKIPGIKPFTHFFSN